MSGQSLASRIALTIISSFGFAFTLLLLFYAINPWLDRLEIPFTRSRTYDSVVFGSLALLCITATVSLLRGKKWAWFVAFGASAVILGSGVVLLLAVLHPTSAFEQSESGFGFGVSLLFMLAGGINFVLLSLPFVRRRYWHRADAH